MNRKKKSKVANKVDAYYKTVSPYDDPENWMDSKSWERPPWPLEKIHEFQKRIDSAFGAENALVLVWSGDRSYGDAFYTDWHSNGLPKGKLERKPVLLFGEYKINEHDYFYLSCPRWLIMEVNHGSQLEAGWEAWVEDNAMMGGRKQIRADKPPEFFYTHWKVIAKHDPMIEGQRACCEKLLKENKICYGLYREPNEEDIALVYNTRKNMDKAGVSQRNDTARDAKVILDAGIASRHFMQQAQRQKATAVQDMMIEFPKAFLGDILEKKGSTMSEAEVREIVKEAFDESNQERFS